MDDQTVGKHRRDRLNIPLVLHFSSIVYIHSNGAYSHFHLCSSPQEQQSSLHYCCPLRQILRSLHSQHALLTALTQQVLPVSDWWTGGWFVTPLLIAVSGSWDMW